MKKKEERKLKETIADHFNLPPELIDKVDLSKAVKYLLYLRSQRGRDEEYLDELEDNRVDGE